MLTSKVLQSNPAQGKSGASHDPHAGSVRAAAVLRLGCIFPVGFFGHGDMVNHQHLAMAQGSPPPEAPGGGLGPGQGCKLVWFSTSNDAGLLRWKALFLNHVLSLVAA